MSNKGQLFATALAIAVLLLYGLLALPALADDMTGETDVAVKAGESLTIDHPNVIPYNAYSFEYSFSTGDESIVSLEHETNASSATIMGVRPGRTEVIGYCAYTIATRTPQEIYDAATGSNKTYYTTEYSEYEYHYRWNVTVIGDPTVIKPREKALTYNGLAQALVSEGCANGGTMQYVLGSSAVSEPASGWSSAVPTGTHAGTYYVWYRVIGDEYYSDTDAVCLAVTIVPTDAVVNAEGKTKTYGDADPQLTYTAEGLVNGDALTGSLTRAQGEDAGSYAITRGTLAASADYNLMFYGADLTIVEREVTVTAADQSVEQGGNINTGLSMASLSGQVGGHALSEVTLSADSTAQATDNGRITPSNAQIIDGSGDVTANYDICYVPGKLRVIARPTDAPTQAPDPTAVPTQTPKPTAAPVPGKIDINKCKMTVRDQYYTGKALKPGVTVKYGAKTVLKKGTDYTLTYRNNKAVGVATVIVKGKGKYTGSKKLTFRIAPKGTTFTKLTGGREQMTLKWKNSTYVKGYEIEYSLKRNFYGGVSVRINKATTLTATVTRLKANRKYYVRIRTFVKSGSKTYYSEWSAVKTVKTKGSATTRNADIGEQDDGVSTGL